MGDAGFALFSLPQALWTYSMIGAVALVWGGRLASVPARLWAASALALSVGSEILQYPAVALLPGRFDPMDVAGSIGAGAMAWLMSGWHSWQIDTDT